MPIILKSRDEIAIMRDAGRIVAEVLQIIMERLRPGL
jgi:methionine aminopeptidase